MEFEPTASPQNKEKKNLKIKKNLIKELSLVAPLLSTNEWITFLFI